MATPGTTVELSFLEAAMIPAKPPKEAMSTSKKKGSVRPSISVVTVLNGVSLK